MSDYEIEKRIDTQAPPTISQVLGVLMRTGLDRGALVREAIEGQREAGILVLFFGMTAVDFGDELMEFAKAYDEAVTPALGQAFQARTSQSVAFLFQWMQVEKIPFVVTLLELPVPPYAVGLFAVHGNEISAILAPYLTERGCPCKLP